MGRGRQKAKQTKVARELKYYSPETNYAQLERELAGRSALGTKDGTSDDSPDQWGWDDEGEQGRPSSR